MVIWRGWGVLAFVYVALALGLFYGAAKAVLDDSMLPFSVALGLILAAVATWFTGRALNVTMPQRKIDAWQDERRAQLQEQVSAGSFTAGPGRPAPTSLSEAEAQSGSILQQELKRARKARNVHTLFFIPMQIWAFIFAAIAVVVLVMGIVGALQG